MTNFQEFIDYVFSFYGEGGLYPLNVTKEQIALATLKYLDNVLSMISKINLGLPTTRRWSGEMVIL